MTATPSDGTSPSRRFIVLLVMMGTVGPLTLNILMPAIPGLVHTFATDAGTAQLTLTLYLLGMAISQLCLGPLADRLGRRPVLIGAMALTVLASVAGAFAHSIGWVIVARTSQALGASAGLVIGRAIIRDLYSRDRAAAMIGLVTMALVVAPMLAPTIGGVLDTTLGWQAIFVFVAVLAAIALVWIWIDLPETRSDAAADLARQGNLLRGAMALMKRRSFLGYLLGASLGGSMFFAFLGGAPHAVITIMGRSSTEYGLWSAIAAIGYMAGNFFSSRYAPRLGIDPLVRYGTVIGVFGALTMFVPAFFAWGLHPAALFVPQLVIAFGNGLLLPNAIAGAVSVDPRLAGSASGIMGFVQMTIGAIASQWVGHALEGATNAMPMAVITLGLGIASLIALAFLSAKPRFPPPTER